MASNWVQLEKPGLVVAKYRYVATDRTHVSFNFGDELEVTHATTTMGWYRGRSLVTRQQGVFPANYTTPADQTSQEHRDLLAVSTDPWLDEINQTVHQWGVMLGQQMKKRQLEAFEEMKNRLADLLEIRRQLMETAAEQDAKQKEGQQEDKRKAARAAMEDRIGRAIRDLNLDVVVRHNTKHVATVLNTGALTLLSYHFDQASDLVSAAAGSSDQSTAPTDEDSGAAQQQQSLVPPIHNRSMLKLSNIMQQPAGGVQQLGSPALNRRNLTASSASLMSPTSSSSLPPPSMSAMPLPLGQQQQQTLSRKDGKIAANAVASGGSGGGGGASAGSSSGNSSGLYQIWVQVWMVLCDVGSDFEVRISLYNKSTGRYITEEWMALFDESCLAKEKARDFGSAQVLMRDIEGPELFNSGDVYVVVKLVRRGGWQPQERGSKQVFNENFLRRPYGAGVLKLDPAKCLVEEAEDRVDLFSGNESMFGVLVESLADGRLTEDIKPNPKSKGVILKTRVYSSTHKELMASGVGLALRGADVMDQIKIPELVMPGTVRNDAYITIEDAELNEKNIEFQFKVRHWKTGEPMGNCLSFGNCDSKQMDSFRSTVLPSSNPHWKEAARIRLEGRKLLDAEVLIELRHYSTSTDGLAKLPKPFGFACLRLSDGGVILSSNRQKITVYKWTEEAVAVTATDAMRKEISKASLSLATWFSSTIFSQNEHLNRLFRWRENNSGITDIVKKLTFVNNDEIVRHLEQIFAALFTILEQVEAEGVQKVVYDAVLFTIGKLTESRSVWNFRPVLDAYFSQFFRSQGLHGPLLRCLTEVMQVLDTNTQIQAAAQSMKALDYLFLIIVQSRVNMNREVQLDNRSDDTFRSNLLSFAETINRVMERDARTLLSAQLFGFKHFPGLLRGMLQFFQPIELCEPLIRFLTVSDHLSSVQKLNTARLAFYNNIITSGIFDTPETRMATFPHIIGFMRKQLQEITDELTPPKPTAGETTATTAPEDRNSKLIDGTKCVEVLGMLVDCLQVRCQVEERNQYMTLMLPLMPLFIAFHKQLTTTAANPTASTPEESEFLKQSLQLVTLVLTLVRCMTLDSWEHNLAMQYINDIERGKFVTSFCNFLLSCLSGGHCAYPHSWGTMVGFQFTTLLKFAYTMEMSPFFRRRVIQFNGAPAEAIASSPIDDVGLCRSFFYLCSHFTKSPELSLTHVSLDNLEKYGDLRAPMSGIIRRTWKLIPKRHSLYPDLIQEFIEMMNIDQKAVNQNALDAYFTAIDSEFHETQGTEKIKALTEQAFDQSTFQQSFSDFFFSSLQTRFQQAGGPLAAKWEEFRSTQAYIDLICKYEGAAPPDPTNADNQIRANHSLLSYLKQNNRVVPFVKYLHLMKKQHEAMGNLTEAGMTLLEQASLYQWSVLDDTPLPAIEHKDLCSFPQQPGWKTKSMLYDMAVDDLDKGKAWEQAINLLNEKIQFTSSVAFDYKQTALALKRQAALYKKLATEERIPTTYYRVGFFGHGYAEDVANKEFIYKGKQLEKLLEFQARVQEQFPGSIPLKKTDYPGPEVTESTGMHMLITQVQISNNTDDNNNNNNAREEFTGSNVFSYSKAFRKEKQKDGENEFLNLALNILLFITKDKFPFTGTCSEVVQRKEVNYTPVEHALKCVKEKNVELSTLIEKYRRELGISTQPLLMALNGVLMAGVNGGIPRYKDAFLSGKYLKQHPQDLEITQKLTAEIQRQVEIVSSGMELHGERCTPDMRDLHNLLAGKLEETKRDWECGQPQSPTTLTPSNSATSPLNTLVSDAN